MWCVYPKKIWFVCFACESCMCLNKCFLWFEWSTCVWLVCSFIPKITRFVCLASESCMCLEQMFYVVWLTNLCVPHVVVYAYHNMTRVFCLWIVPVLETSVLCGLGDKPVCASCACLYWRKMIRLCFCLWNMSVPKTSVWCGLTDKPVCASCDCVYLK